MTLSLEEILRIEDLTCRYPTMEKPVVNGVHFSLNKGEFGLILGPSGCGKSTLLLCIRGLLPTEVDAEVTGTLFVGGETPTEENVLALAERVFLVQQDPDGQLAAFVVEDDVAFGLENLRVPSDEIRTRIQEALGRVGLLHLRQKETYNLSGGQKQRLGIASGLAMRSGLLLLDAPTSNLDPAGTQEIMETLDMLRRDGTQAVLLVESKVDEAVARVDKLIILDQRGTVLGHGEPRQVLQRLSHEDRQALGLRLPQVSELFIALRERGLAAGQLPLTVEEARTQLEGLRSRGQVHFDGSSIPEPAPMTIGTEPVIEVEDLSFTYPDGTAALRGPISLRIERGDFIGIVGNNGGGKTTLCLNLIGILRPTRGRIRLAGRDTAHMSTREITARVGYSFQQPARQMVANTVYDEVAYGLRLRRTMPEAEINREVLAVLDHFRLADVLHRHPLALSMGQMRRLSVASMLILKPDAFLLDEPMQGLDRESQELLMGILIEAKRRGTTILVVSHDMRTVAEYTNKILFIDQGSLNYFGDTRRYFGDWLPEYGRSAILPPPVTQLALSLQEHGVSRYTLTVEEMVRQVRLEGGAG